MSIDLNIEEQFLWAAARGWRRPESVSIPPDLDWPHLAPLAVKNRMATLLRNLLVARGLWEAVPEPARTDIGASADRLDENAAVMGASLADYLRQAHARGLEIVVLKGLSISVNIYGDPAMRPGGDIDILVRPEQVWESIDILEAMGIGQFWPNLMADPYYERHHLHHQRCSQDVKLWYEIHWALDHPYTLFTIDYRRMMDRSTPGELLGSPVRDLAPPDLLLSLAVHLVKHAIHLPDTVGRPDLARAVLAGGMLMYYLDIAEAIGVLGDNLDWEALVRLAQETGTVETFGAVLRACRSLLDAPVPAGVLDRLPVRGSGPVARRAMNAVVDREIAQHLGQPPSKFWDIMLITNGAFILRPIRLLESAPYFLPPAEFLRRRYGRSHFGVRLSHFLRAVWQFTRFGFDSVYFAVERHNRLKRIGYSTSLFNRLETGG